MTLTEKEKTAIIALVKDGMNVIGATHPSELKEENQTWFKASSLSKATGFNLRVAAGLMSSLNKKDMIVDNADGAEYHWFVTENGIDWVIENFK